MKLLLDPVAHPQAFYGLLDSTQIEYLTQVSGIIEANAFSSDEGKADTYYCEV